MVKSMADCVEIVLRFRELYSTKFFTKKISPQYCRNYKLSFIKLRKKFLCIQKKNNYQN